MAPVIVVHGGAGARVSPDREERVRQGVARAAAAGYRILTAGGSALDAVEGAVAALEDDPEFNAGCGSVLNARGDVEMDASIMSGKDLSSGAVAAVRGIANPIRLARLVMEKTPHCLLAGQGAAEFAAAMGVPAVPGEQLVTERSRKDLERERQKAQDPDQHGGWGTVGAVALDGRGDVAYATSTGGIVNKMVGRVGDTPCVGSGGYADNAIGAASTTGHGESILKVTLARLALFHVEQGKTLEEAAALALGHMQSRLQGVGGVILLDRAGAWAARWTSESMAWAAATGGKLHVGVNLGDTRVADLA